MDPLDLRTRVLLTLQSALLGEVTPPLRGVACLWDEERIVLRAVWDCGASEEQREGLERVTSQVAAAFPDHTVELHQVRRDAPQPVNDLALQAWVFLRHEQAGQAGSQPL